MPVDEIETEDAVTLKVGDRAFNYYDHKVGTILGPINERDSWFDFAQDDGTTKLLNGARICSLDFAIRRGWISPGQAKGNQS